MKVIIILAIIPGGPLVVRMVHLKKNCDSSVTSSQSGLHTDLRGFSGDNESLCFILLNL